MNIKPINLGVSGRYKLEIVNSKTGKKRKTAWIKNLITDAGMNYIGSSTVSLTGGVKYVHVGSGSTTPANTDTSLVSEIAKTTNSIGSNDRGYVAGSHIYSRKGWSFNTPGEAAGNISEIGISNDGTTLLSRALILDSGGSPTTITVAADEILNVYYEYRVYFPTGDDTGSITNTDDSSSYNYTIRAKAVHLSSIWDPDEAFGNSGFSSDINCFGSSFSLSAIDTSFSTGQENTSNGVWDSYSAGSFQRTRRWDMSLSQGNASGGIGGMEFSLGGTGWQVKFDTPIPKDNTKVLNGFNATISWSRAVI